MHVDRYSFIDSSTAILLSTAMAMLGDVIRQTTCAMLLAIGIGRHAFHQQSLSVSGFSASAMEYDVFTHLRFSRPFAFMHTLVGPVPRYFLAYRRCRKLEISPHHLMSGWSVS